MWGWMGFVHSTVVVLERALAIVLPFLDISEVAQHFAWVTSSLYILFPVMFFVFSCSELFKHSQLWF